MRFLLFFRLRLPTVTRTFDPRNWGQNPESRRRWVNKHARKPARRRLRSDKDAVQCQRRVPCTTTWWSLLASCWLMIITSIEYFDKGKVLRAYGVSKVSVCGLKLGSAYESLRQSQAVIPWRNCPKDDFRRVPVEVPSEESLLHLWWSRSSKFY